MLEAEFVSKGFMLSLVFSLVMAANQQCMFVYTAFGFSGSAMICCLILFKLVIGWLFTWQS